MKQEIIFDARESGENQSVPKKISKPRILVVEDNMVNQKAAEGLLNILGCDVDIAANGRTAISAYSKNYDLVILDIGLPDIDGVDVCRQIRSDDEFQTPIIAYTAHGTRLEAKCREAGVNHFAVKPLLLNQIRELLSQWIPDYETRCVVKAKNNSVNV